MSTRICMVVYRKCMIIYWWFTTRIVSDRKYLLIIEITINSDTKASLFSNASRYIYYMKVYCLKFTLIPLIYLYFFSIVFITLQMFYRFFNIVNFSSTYEHLLLFITILFLLRINTNHNNIAHVIYLLQYLIEVYIRFYYTISFILANINCTINNLRSHYDRSVGQWRPIITRIQSDNRSIFI